MTFSDMEVMIMMLDEEPTFDIGKAIKKFGGGMSVKEMIHTPTVNELAHKKTRSKKKKLAKRARRLNKKKRR